MKRKASDLSKPFRLVAIFALVVAALTATAAKKL